VSHGCVNVAVNHAEWLFHWASVGTPVIVHEGDWCRSIAAQCEQTLIFAKVGSDFLKQSSWLELTPEENLTDRLGDYKVS
jgi:L,D-transpeptidase catalytic domain